MGAGPRGPQQLKSFLRRRIEVFQDHQKSHKKSLIGYALGTVAILITAGVAYGAQISLRNELVSKPNDGTAKFDPTVQKATENILKKYVRKFGARGGFVLVADPQTGRVLAVANQISIPGKQQKSWALSYEMEPASVMKGVVAASAMDQGLIQPDEKIDCENGMYSYGGHVYRDWKSFGPLTTTEVIANSSNICGIKIGAKLGAKGLEKSLKSFGFGSKGVAAEFPVDFSDSSSVGVVMKQAISPATAQKMKSVLSDVVKNGTGKNAQSSLYSTAGKTSTAYRPESPEHDSLGGERGIAGFVGFAPVQNPRLVVYVGVIDPTNSYDHNPHGNEHAAPIFKEVIETVLQSMNVASDKASL
jgi:cell division protein FtsI (penicillin-binding protein 3)